MLILRMLAVLLANCRSEVTWCRICVAMHDRHAKARFFASGDAAYALRYHGNKESWVHGSIVEQTGPLSYIVRLDDGSVVRCHVDQLQRGITSPPVAPPTLRVPIEVRQPLQLQEDVESSGEPNSSSPSVSLDSPAPDQRLNCSPTPVPVTEPRRSLRFRNIYVFGTILVFDISSSLEWGGILHV